GGRDEDVVAHRGGDAGVVHAAVDASPPLERRVEVAPVVAELGDRAADVDRLAALAELGHELGRLLAGGEDRDGVPLVEQAGGDAQSDAPVPPGHHRYLRHVSSSPSSGRPVRPGPRGGPSRPGHHGPPRRAWQALSLDGAPGSGTPGGRGAPVPRTARPVTVRAVGGTGASPWKERIVSRRG